MNDSGKIKIGGAQDATARLRQLLPELAARFGVASLAVFGSRTRGEHRTDSDLDVLVTFSRTPGLFRFLEVENRLSDELGVKVDLVMRDALKPGLGERILAEAIAV